MNEKAKKLFYRGVHYFNIKDYYEAHEYFEEMWTDYKLEDRLFIQALIQLFLLVLLFLVLPLTRKF